MSLTWAQIRTYYLGIAGRETDAVAEAYDHLTAGYRRLCSLVDVEELYQDDATVTVADGADYVEMDCDVYAIYYVFNLTKQNRVTPEEGGMRGRSRFLGSNGKPPEGTVSYYARAGSRLYLRDAANGEQTLKLQFKVNPPDVTSSDLAEHPLTPAYLDWALVNFAAANYFAAHPDRESRPGEAGGPLVTFESLEQRALAILAEPRTPKSRENDDRREWVRQPGYSFNLQMAFIKGSMTSCRDSGGTFTEGALASPRDRNSGVLIALDPFDTPLVDTTLYDVSASGFRLRVRESCRDE